MPRQTPRLYIAHFTNSHTQHVWQVIERGMPICAETTEPEQAHAVYQSRWLQLRNHDPGVTALPTFYNGDLDEFDPAW